jgi:L-amino acid N-acyltransferase YncA
MTYLIRFGCDADLEDISTIDPNVSKPILLWKLMNREIVLATEDGVMVGYLRLEFLWSKYPYLGLIIVNSSHRKQGIGKAMLSCLEDHLRKQGIAALYSSSQVNEPEPQQWHRYVGFKECGVINGINPGGVGELFFVKSI